MGKVVDFAAPTRLVERINDRARELGYGLAATHQWQRRAAAFWATHSYPLDEVVRLSVPPQTTTLQDLQERPL